MIKLPDKVTGRRKRREYRSNGATRGIIWGKRSFEANVFFMRNGMEKSNNHKYTCGIRIPSGASGIIRILREHGHEGYVVGGCVRDALLGRAPHDWDITTSARPMQVREIFRRTVDTGIAHGTVTVLIGDEAFEVTTYRIDGAYTDGRHPDSVTFTPSLEEDLKRRDFTINAMAFSEEKGLVDLFDGVGDLGRKLVRCVGDPAARFGEDALRIMRAVRFAAQLDFELDGRTAAAAQALAPTLSKISAERVRDELVKLICSGRPGLLDTARQLGITRVILPEFDGLFDVGLRADGACDGAGEADGHDAGPDTPAFRPGLHTAGEHTLQTMCNINEPDPVRLEILRLTMLLHDMGKEKITPVHAPAGNGEWKFPGHAAQSAQMAQQILRRLKFDNETIRAVTTLIRLHTDLPDAMPADVRRMMHTVGPELFPLWLQVKRADIQAQSGKKRGQRLAQLEEIERVYARILQDKDPVMLGDLAVSGRELIADGMRPGPQMGKVLHALLEKVLEDPSLNSRKQLIEESRRVRKEMEGL